LRMRSFLNSLRMNYGAGHQIALGHVFMSLFIQS
jgi:hypothetical protein